MDRSMTAGTRDLVLSGSFAMPVAAVRLRAEQGKLAAVLCHDTSLIDTSLIDTSLIDTSLIDTSLIGTSLIGTDVPVIDRMRLSAAEP